MLAAFQLAMNRIDWQSKAAIDTIFGPNPERRVAPGGVHARPRPRRVRHARREPLVHLQRRPRRRVRAPRAAPPSPAQLGAAFYRKMSAGEIMSRSTSDLQQVRLLSGFGVLNIVNVVFAFASALQVMVRDLAASSRSSAFVTLPLLVVITRSFSKTLFTRTRANQEALGKLSDVAADEPRGRARRAQLRARDARARALPARRTRPTSRRASRSRASAARWGR